MAINYDDQEGFGLAPIKQESIGPSTPIDTLALDYETWMEIPIFPNRRREDVHALVDEWLDEWVRTGGHPGA